MHRRSLLHPTAAMALCLATLVAGTSGQAQTLVDATLAQNPGVPRPTLPYVRVPQGSVVADDFNRPDGPIGPLWTVVDGSFNVVGNRADAGSSLSRALLTGAVSSVVEMDIAMTGTGTDYVAAVLDQGAGASNIFVKVQNNGGTPLFDRAGCYTGNNGPGFGLGFFSLSAPFATAHMRVSVDALRVVTLELTNIDGGAGTQTYVCTGAPPAEGTGAGIGNFAAGLGFIDNFAVDGVADADLSIVMTDAPDPVVAGTNLTYTVTVANAGPSDAANVTASMATPTGTTLVSAPGPIGTLAAGASVQSTFVFTVTPAVLSGTVITGTATVTSSTTDPNAANNTASTTTTVSAEANLAATLTASASAVLVNVPVTFSSTSTNLGPSDAQNVVLAITLSPDFRYAGHTASAGAVCTTPQVGNSGVISCTWAGATAPNAVRTLDVSAFSNNDNQNTVSVATSSATTDPVAANNTASVVVTVGFLIEEIPSLNGLGLALLGLMLALAGFVAVRRNS